LEVVVFDLAKAYQPPKGVTFVCGDLTAKETLKETLLKHKVQAVFHVASPDPNSQNKALFKAVNVDGTSNVIASCLAANVSTLIFTSSASTVWQGAGQEGLDESAPVPTSFRDAYAETKAQAEALIMAAGKKHGDKLRTISLRPHSIFGPRDPTMVPTAASLAKAGRQRFIVGNGDNLVDWTFVGNVVHSHLLAAEVAQKEGSQCAAISCFSWGTLRSSL
jgi:sterol-4alpha-carboxylate 3-dehydrogenase (decarboxylating)